MKTRELLILAVSAVMCCAGSGYAASALGLTAEEMSKLYGADFARQTTDAQKLMDEEWDANLEEEEAAEEATEPSAEPAPETPAPADPAADDTPAPEPPAADAEEANQDTAPKEKKDAKKDNTPKKKVLKNTIQLVKAKRAVDAKIKYSRNNITTLRKKLYGIAKRYGVEPSDTYSGGEYGSGLKNLDLIVVKNSQEAIQKYKEAIPQLWAFSNELDQHIRQGMKAIGKTKNKVLLSFKPGDIQPPDGSETEKDPVDKYNYKNIYKSEY